MKPLHHRKVPPIVITLESSCTAGAGSAGAGEGLFSAVSSGADSSNTGSDFSSCTSGSGSCSGSGSGSGSASAAVSSRCSSMSLLLSPQKRNQKWYHIWLDHRMVRNTTCSIQNSITLLSRGRTELICLDEATLHKHASLTIVRYRPSKHCIYRKSGVPAFSLTALKFHLSFNCQKGQWWVALSSFDLFYKQSVLHNTWLNLM